MDDVTTPVFDKELRGTTLVVTPLENLRELEYARIEEAAEGVLQDLDACQIKHVVLDFRKTDFYGSTALGFFVKLWKRIRCAGGKMAFCNVSPHEREVLELTHLDRNWPVCNTLIEALAAVEK
jgi:anti-anti-sigma factor